MKNSVDDSLKSNSFSGLYNAISLENFKNHLNILLEAYTSLKHPSNEIKNKMSRILFSKL